MKNEVERFSSENLRSRSQKIEVLESYFATVRDKLGEDVFGQQEACAAVARAVTRYESGINDPRHPAGVLLFLGPTGVGKTEMSKALSRHLFGSVDQTNYKIIDCSEFSESHTISRFIGSPPGYVGYGDCLVIEASFLNNRNVIVFDEIEKADPALWKMLLSIFESGTLKARAHTRKKEVDEIDLNFSNSFIILTSNVGARKILDAQKHKLGFLNQPTEIDLKKAAMAGLQSFFGDIPEFLGRIDEFIVFNDLKPEHYELIYWKFIGEISSQMRHRVGVDFSTTSELAEQILSIAVEDNCFGARNIRHTIDKLLIQPLVDVLVSHPELKKVVADTEEGSVIFYDLTPEMPANAPEEVEEIDLEKRLETVLQATDASSEISMTECEDKLSQYFKDNPDKHRLFERILGNIAIKDGKIVVQKGQEVKIARALTMIAFISNFNRSMLSSQNDRETEEKMVKTLELYRRVSQGIRHS